MVSLSVIILTMISKMISPLSLSITLLLISIMSTKMIYKECASSWLPFVVIITFSSGMMTLFMYTTSMTSNEKNKITKKPLMMLMVLATLTLKKVSSEKPSMNMKSFSMQNLLMLMGIILILTLLAVSSHGHHPNQTLNSSF